MSSNIDNFRVIIKIPLKKFKKWIKQNSFRINRANSLTKKSLEDDVSDFATVSFYAVAYTNSWSMKDDEEEIVSCGGTINRLIKNVKKSNSLLGYVKDNAWSYENEIRLRVDIRDRILCDAISIDIPDYIIDSNFPHQK